MSIRQDVIDQVAREIYPGQRWGEEWATVCERAGYKCEYCDKDMLASQNDYLSMQNDHIAVLNHLSAKLYWLNLGNWKYFFCRMPLTNRSLICSKQVVHTAWVRTKVLPFNQRSSTGFSCGV